MSGEKGFDRLEEALRAVRESSAGLRAPDAVEDRLLAAFRAHQAAAVPIARPRGRRPYVWIAGAVAASVVLAAALRLSQPRVVVELPKPARVAAMPPGAPESIAVKSDPLQPARPRPAAIRRQPKKPAAAVSAAAREVSTPFLPVPYAPALTPEDRGHVVRVKLPAASMRTFGLPVAEDRTFERVKADVLLGEDGIARAIRFVH